MTQAKQILIDFVQRMERPATEITAWARPHLENLSNAVLGVIPPNGFPNDHQRIIKQYQAAFQQRVDGTLRGVEIGYVKEAGFTAGAAMSEKEEWIGAARALTLLGMKQLPGTRTICNRAHAGLIKARATRFIRAGKSADNVDVPAEFWWAKGGEALSQNWTTGDFDTWIDHRIHLQAFGVTFRRSDIEQLKAAPGVENAPAPVSMPARATGGRPKASWSDDLWIEMCRQLYEGDLQPKKQGDVTKAMMDWLTERGEDFSETSVKDRARKLWAVIGKADKN